MGILVIGDAFTGKTQFINALAEPEANQRVQPIDWTYFDGKTIQRTSAGSTASKPLEVLVHLPSGSKHLLVEVMDTPGEVWKNENRAEIYAQDWQAIREVSVQSEGIFLILPPYNDLLRAEEQNHTGQIIEGNHSGGSIAEWKSRFQSWIEFFKRDCPRSRHILLCINKADLFERDISALANQFAYTPNQGMGWQDRHQYLIRRHFQPIAKEINELSQFKQKGEPGSVQCFLTSIYHRSLLELPWIYLASFLSSDHQFLA